MESILVPTLLIPSVLNLQLLTKTGTVLMLFPMLIYCKLSPRPVFCLWC